MEASDGILLALNDGKRTYEEIKQFFGKQDYGLLPRETFYWAVRSKLKPYVTVTRKGKRALYSLNSKGVVRAEEVQTKAKSQEFPPSKMTVRITRNNPLKRALITILLPFEWYCYDTDSRPLSEMIYRETRTRQGADSLTKFLAGALHFWVSYMSVPNRPATEVIPPDVLAVHSTEADVQRWFNIFEKRRMQSMQQ